MSDRPSTGVVIQARMGSSRLPGKVAEVIGGLPALVLQVRRLAPSRLPVVVATSDLDRDDRVAALAAQAGVEVVRGSEIDVLERFASAARLLGTEHVVRLTGDCPLTDPAVVLDAVRLHLDAKADYTSNVLPRTYPKGLDVEVVRSDVLFAADVEAVEPPDREHVLPFVYRRPERFRLANLVTASDHSHERWTLDTHEDLERIRSLMADEPDATGVALADLLRLHGTAPPRLAGSFRLRVATEADVTSGATPNSLPGANPWVRSWVLTDDEQVVALLDARTGPPGGERTSEPLQDDPAVRRAARAALESVLDGDQQLRP